MKTITVKQLVKDTEEKITFSCSEAIEEYLFSIVDDKDIFKPSIHFTIKESAEWIWGLRPGCSYATSAFLCYFFSCDKREKLPVDELEECQKENELNYYGGRA